MTLLSSLGLLAVIFLLVPNGVELMAVLWGKHVDAGEVWHGCE
jgi:hypothetical protein